MRSGCVASQSAKDSICEIETGLSGSGQHDRMGARGGVVDAVVVGWVLPSARRSGTKVMLFMAMECWRRYKMDDIPCPTSKVVRQFYELLRIAVKSFKTSSKNNDALQPLIKEASYCILFFSLFLDYSVRLGPMQYGLIAGYIEYSRARLAGYTTQ